MELPVHDERRPAVRSASNVRAMAIAVQANLVQLKVAGARRGGIDPADHPIVVASPGTVRRFRDTLIDRATIQAYSNTELPLRLHEVWGRYCLFRWLFSLDGADPNTNPAKIPEDASMRCDAVIEAKVAETQAVLWRIRHEQQRRASSDADLSDDAKDMAQQIPATLFGKSLEACGDEEVILGACQHAGMLGTLRWILDARLSWDDPGLMDAGDHPFR